MKIFVTGRFPDVKNIKRVIKILKKHNHEIIFDWTKKGNLKPYDKNFLKSKNFSKKAIEAIGNSDVFIFVAHPEIAGGSSVELGAAINSFINIGKPKIYLIGKFNTKVIFYFHPAVTKLDSIEEVLSKL